jgi:malonyl CoA-acyl carrier protein transacylase
MAEAMGGLDALLASITSAIGHSQGVTAAVIVGAAEGKNSFGALAR